MTTATAFNTSDTVTEGMWAGIEAEFAGYRSRIAMMAAEVMDTATDMFNPLGPVVDVPVIDIEAIECDSFDLAALIDDQDAVVLEFATA